MLAARIRNHLHFAFHKESSNARENIPVNRLEIIGNWLSWFVYDFRKVASRYLFDPRSITVVLTWIAMSFVALLFYPSTTWNLFVDSVTWVVDHINWQYVRFVLWLLSEITVMGLGLRAFGRFSNSELTQLHGMV